ncbi:SET domain-containing protein [Aureococcus anophagefferens]|nr:SET domain-containing protein [Aureococcus anophagefferens]
MPAPRTWSAPMPLTPHEGSPDFQPADELFADGSPPADGAPPPAKKHRPERHGKWTAPEEAYASLVIDHFINGKAPGCAGGESLRALLAGLLRCTPMRITKKFSRTRAMGKSKSFRKTSELTAYERFELDAARAAFLKMGGRKESRKRPRSDADAARHDWLTSGWQFEDHLLHGGAPDLGLQWRRRKQVAAPPAASVAPATARRAVASRRAARPAAPADGEDAPSPPPPPVVPADGEDAPPPPVAPAAARTPPPPAAR